MTSLRLFLCCSFLAGQWPAVSKCALAAENREATTDLAPTTLRCEYRADPLGIDESAPRLSWQVVSLQRGQKQTSYRILVASSPEKLGQSQGDLWDSGQVAGNQTTHVVYRGQPLQSRQLCYWKVRVWDKDGQPSDWSVPARWTMGLLQPPDWQAQFISVRDLSPLHTNRQALHLPPARHYRKAFDSSRPIRRATVYATALGIYELHLNGQRIGEACFTPGWSDYRRRVYYQTYDVTSLIRTGPNAFGAIVADGWYSGYVGFGLLVGYGPNQVGRYLYGKTPALLAQLELEYADGTRAIFGTDASWKTSAAGPFREADLLMGETYDAREEVSGWAEPGFVDSDWKPAIPAEDNGRLQATFHDGAGARPVELGFIRPAKLQAYPSVPVRHIEEIQPIALTSPTNGVFIFNLGQNISGIARLKIRGDRGTRIQLRFGEMLHPDGRLMTENLRRARALDTYILRGDPQGETWTPRFTFHGFQYVEVTGFPGRPGLDAITGIVVHSDTPLTSSFECSDPMVNQLFRNVVWTQRDNFLDLPTDCPQRDERMGWMGDAQIYARTATYNADVGAFFTKWLDDVDEAQLPNGAFPDFAPFVMQHGQAFATGWMDAGVICPWTIYQVYGDTRVIERHYPAMRRFLEFRQQASRDFLGVAHGNTWGDWLSLDEPTPLEYLDTAYFAYTASLMAQMAQAIDRPTDAEAYRRLYDQIKTAFVKKYVQPDGTLQVDTQTAYALALSTGLIPDGLRQPAGDRLAQKIRDRGFRMATGFLGTRPLLPVLSSVGHHDLAARLLQSRRFPSWGYEIENGATTIWERWNSYTRDQGFGDASMNSFAHYSFGAVCEWMFSTLAGIDTDGPGFQQLRLQPAPPRLSSNPEQPVIGWVKARYDSIHGRIVSQWRRTPDRFELEITIPANTTATVFLPAADSKTATESGQPLNRASGVKWLRQENNRAVLAVESGTYRFVSHP